MNLNKIHQPFKDIFPGDHSRNSMQRKTPHVLYCEVIPEKFPRPELLLFNEKLSEEIGLGALNLSEDLPFLAAASFDKDKTPYATAYAGHQFGNWAGQLGDGRAIIAGEIVNDKGQRTELQWKGAGATPYSRNADGRAVFRSSLREYLMSEAMHFLGIPTTRALSLLKTGEEVVRDMMYDGNPQSEQGAVLLRTAESFLRFGHFELLSASGDHDLLKKLMDFTIDRYFPDIQRSGSERYLHWLQAVARKTADTMVDWYRVGFVHGVMNTDNMSVLGLTIDYGPFAMIEEYDLNFTSNTTDLPGRRYAFGQQGHIAQWNLWQLLNAVYPILKDQKELQCILDDFGIYFWKRYDEMMAHKFGFPEVSDNDVPFFTDWQNLMQDLKLDYTLFFIHLENVLKSSDLSRFDPSEISYKQLSEKEHKAFSELMIRYRRKIGAEADTISTHQRTQLMEKTNPKFVLRNYLLYECIDEVSNGRTEMLDKLLDAIQNPYEMRSPEFAIKRPSKYNSVPGCSMLSCSS